MAKNTQANNTNAKNDEAKVEKFDRVAFIAQCGSKSQAIRKLLAQGKTRGEVAKMLDVLYQHVRNVQITPIKQARAATTYVAPTLPGADTAHFDEFGLK